MFMLDVARAEVESVAADVPSPALDRCGIAHDRSAVKTPFVHYPSGEVESVRD
jgi:hypothetical protein